MKWINLWIKKFPRLYLNEIAFYLRLQKQKISARRGHWYNLYSISMMNHNQSSYKRITVMPLCPTGLLQLSFNPQGQPVPNL